MFFLKSEKNEKKRILEHCRYHSRFVQATSQNIVSHLALMRSHCTEKSDDRDRGEVACLICSRFTTSSYSCWSIVDRLTSPWQCSPSLCVRKNRTNVNSRCYFVSFTDDITNNSGDRTSEAIHGVK